MASRIKNANTHPCNTSWQKVEVEDLVDLLARRTGLNEREIRQVLQELKDTNIFVQYPDLADRCGGNWGRRKR